MTAPSPIPRRVKGPSWLDPRLMIGAAIVLGSVLLGAKTVAAASHTYPAVAVSEDVAGGTVLSAADVHTIRVQIPDRGVYETNPAAVIGRLLNRALSRGEMVPQSALGMPAEETTVTIPLGADSAPALSAGQRITVWLSTKVCPSVVVLPDVTVQSAHDSGGGSFASAGGQDVVVDLAPSLADRVVSALAQDGATIRAGVRTGPSHAGDPVPDLKCQS